MTTEITSEMRREIVRQIGIPNVAAISGGRAKALPDGIELPVSNGYSVQVQLDLANDTYTVTRMFRRNGKEWIKGQKSGVYCDDVSEQAYRASCFRSYDEGEW